ncbi:hypothetical protein GN956_G23416, partial [Arapaima gigas]
SEYNSQWQVAGSPLMSSSEEPTGGPPGRPPGSQGVPPDQGQCQRFNSKEQEAGSRCPSAGDSDMELETEDEGSEEEPWNRDWTLDEGRMVKGNITDRVCPEQGGEGEVAGTPPPSGTVIGVQSAWGLSTVLNMGAHASMDWHFPSEPALDHMMHCPPWQLPPMDYCPVPQQLVPFEGGNTLSGTAVPCRSWEDVSDSQEETAPRDAVHFTVMSYNILAQDLLEANAELYGHCEPHVLHWEFRLHNLLCDFHKWKPDIMCLQEVQEKHFRERLDPVLAALGYKCVYKRRSGTKTDGCAICYQCCRFSQVSVRLVEFFRPQLEVLNRDNVAVVLLLQPVVSPWSDSRAPGPLLCVATTHLLFNPRRGDVKLAQLAVLLAEIDEAVKPWKSKGVHCPIILCGDFNALPNTPLYQLITTGQLYYHGMPAWMVSGQEDLSYKMHQRMLCAPLWPTNLGISNSCQYLAGHKRATESKESGGMECGSERPARIQYNHDFLRQLRFCQAACIRPQDLEVISGVTDATPGIAMWVGFCVLHYRVNSTLCHGLRLHSAYTHYVCGTEQPEVTTLHLGCGATVDYIFYSCDSKRCVEHTGGQPGQNECLKLTGRLNLLSEESLWMMNGLPNNVFPSDHLLLLARFQLEHAQRFLADGAGWEQWAVDKDMSLWTQKSESLILSGTRELSP